MATAMTVMINGDDAVQLKIEVDDPTLANWSGSCPTSNPADGGWHDQSVLLTEVDKKRPRSAKALLHWEGPGTVLVLRGLSAFTPN